MDRNNSSKNRNTIIHNYSNNFMQNKTLLHHMRHYITTEKCIILSLRSVENGGGGFFLAYKDSFPTFKKFSYQLVHTNPTH